MKSNASPSSPRSSRRWWTRGGGNAAEQVSRDPLRGNLFENLVVSDLLKRNLNRDGESELFFFRASDGIEADVLRKTGKGLQPIEIKSAMTWTGEAQGSPRWDGHSGRTSSLTPIFRSAALCFSTSALISF